MHFKDQQKQIAVVAIMLVVTGKLRLPIGSDVTMVEIKGDHLHCVSRSLQSIFNVAGCGEKIRIALG